MNVILLMYVLVAMLLSELPANVQVMYMLAGLAIVLVDKAIKRKSR